MAVLALILFTAATVGILFTAAGRADARHLRAHCQVCGGGLGAVILTDIRPHLGLCRRHADTHTRITALEAELFQPPGHADPARSAGRAANRAHSSSSVPAS